MNRFLVKTVFVMWVESLMICFAVWYLGVVGLILLPILAVPYGMLSEWMLIEKTQREYDKYTEGYSSVTFLIWGIIIGFTEPSWQTPFIVFIINLGLVCILTDLLKKHIVITKGGYQKVLN